MAISAVLDPGKGLEISGGYSPKCVSSTLDFSLFLERLHVLDHVILGIWNSHEDFDNPSNPLTHILNIFYYSFIITYVFCASYKVREGFELSREELGSGDEH